MRQQPRAENSAIEMRHIHPHSYPSYTGVVGERGYSRAHARYGPSPMGDFVILETMMMTEKRLWKRVREAMRGVPGWHGTRVEASSGEVVMGTPDAVITASGRTRWVELKVYPEPLNPHQRAWAAERDASGADAVMVLAGIRDGVALVPWRAYDEGNPLGGWHGSMKELPRAFESRTWHSVEKIRPQNDTPRK